MKKENIFSFVLPKTYDVLSPAFSESTFSETGKMWKDIPNMKRITIALPTGQSVK